MTDIYAALAAVMKDCDHVAKRDVNTDQRYYFRGVDAVVNAVGPILRKHSVIVIPTARDITYEPVTTSRDKKATACRVLVDYTFYAADGSNVTATVGAEAWDWGDKAAPKAMAVAWRIALIQALALPTDDPDPDAQTFEKGKAAEPAAQQTTRRMARNQPADPEPATNGHITPKQSQAMHATFNEAGITQRDARLDYCKHLIGRDITTSNDLTHAEASRVIDALKKDAGQP